MFKKRRRFLLIIVIICMVSIVFIYKQFIEEKPKVVLVLKDLDLEYWQYIKAGAEKGFEDFGIEGKVIAPKIGTVEAQTEMLERVLKEKPDVLVVSPVYAPSVIPQMEEFVERDIPVLLIQTDDPWKNKTSYIGTDDLELGKRIGVLMASRLQPGDQVALLSGRTSVDNRRLKGAKASLEAVGIKIVTEKEGLPNDDIHSEVVTNLMETILQEHPNLKGVVATSDYIALPALNVIEKQGLKMPVVGANGITEMLELVEKGKLSSAIAQNPYDMGYLSVQAASKVINGEKVSENIDSDVDIITEGNVAERLAFLKGVLK